MISNDTLNEQDSQPAITNRAAGAAVEIEVLLSNVIFGPFTAAKIHERLAENLLALTDQARFAYSETWTPLKDLLENLPSEPAAEPPAVATSPPPATQEAEPEEEEATPRPAEPAPIKPPGMVRQATSVMPPQPPVASPTASSTLPAQGIRTSRVGTGPLPAPVRKTTTLAQPGTKSGALSSARSNPARPGTTPLGGIRSQILAHTASGGLTAPTPTGFPRMPGRAMTSPLSMSPATSPTPPPAPESKPAPASIAASAPVPVEVTEPSPGVPESKSETPAGLESPPRPPPRPISSPFPRNVTLSRPAATAPEAAATLPPMAKTPGPIGPGAASPGASSFLPKPPEREFTPMRMPARFPTSRPKLDEDEDEPVPASAPVPVPTAAPLEAEEPTPTSAEKTEEPAAAVEPLVPVMEPIRAEAPVASTQAPEVAHLSTDTRSISIAALATGALPLPPARPAETRPKATADSILTVRLPARRTQVIKTLPGAAVKGPDTKPADSPAGSPDTATRALTTRPFMDKQDEPPSQTVVTPEKEIPMPRPALKSAINPVRRGMANASAMAATTLLQPSEKKASVQIDSAKKENSPLTVSPPAAHTPAFSPPKKIDPAPESSPVTTEAALPPPSTPLAETRRTALKQARQKRKRQGMIIAAIGFIIFVLLCAGIFHYTASSRDGEKPIPAPTPLAPSLKTTLSPPAEAPTTVVAEVPSPAPPSTSSPAATNTVAASPPASEPAAISPPAAPAEDPKVLTHISSGQAAQAKGDYEGAVGEFTQALTLDPKYAQGYGFRAAANQAKGDLDHALADTNQLLTLDPNNANGFCQRGFLKESNKDEDGAVADYSRAIQLDPKSFIAFYNRGMIMEQKGQPDAAIADYNQALQLNPKLAGAFFNRGNAKMDKVDLDGAIADFTNALEMNPKIALAASNRGLAEQNQGNLDAALADYNQALGTNPKIAMAYYNRGLIEEQRNNLDACIDDSTKALEISPDDAQAYYNRGLALEAEGNLDAAVNDLRKFEELAPKNIYADYAHLYLWIIVSQQNHKAQANQELAGSLDSSWNAEPAELASKIAGFLLDRVTEGDLLAVASSTDTRKDQSQHCEVWYFDGMKKMLTGNKNGAIDCFHQCLSTGQKDFCEYILAQHQLQSLSAGWFEAPGPAIHTDPARTASPIVTAANAG